MRPFISPGSLLMGLVLFAAKHKAVPTRPWWLLWLVVPAVLLLLWVLWAVRRRVPPGVAEADAGPLGEEAGDPWEQPVPAEGSPISSVEGARIRQRCVRCHEVLKIPREMAGKRFQCPRCGTVQLVAS